jgi:16S rRNA (uracil1498-N3)-methyltransferase
VPPEALDADLVVFGAREARHIAAVLRLRPGTRITVFDGVREADAELREAGEAGVVARLTSAPRASGRTVEVTLLQGMARGPRMDAAVRMATEVGVTAIVPVVTARSMPAPGAERVARWERIAREAARQCGRTDVPAVAPAACLDAALAALGPVDLLVVPWEQEVRPIGEVVAGTRFVTSAVLVGPEGGLADAEVATARAAGGVTVSLGPLVLRTETAGVVTVAMLLYERMLRGSS